MNNINVVYTPWGNLKKTGDMDVGQIGFFRQKDASHFSTKFVIKYEIHMNFVELEMI